MVSLTPGPRRGVGTVPQLTLCSGEPQGGCLRVATRSSTHLRETEVDVSKVPRDTSQ